MIKVPIHQEWHSNSKYVCTKPQLKNLWRRKNKNLIELKGKISKFTNKARDFSVSLRIIDGTTKQKMPKDTFQIHQISKIEHILGHKTNLNKFNKLEGYSVFSDHSGIEPKVTERWGRFFKQLKAKQHNSK